METVIFSLLLLHGAAAVLHSLKFFEAAASGVPNFPEYVAVGQVDGVAITHYDSNTRHLRLTQDWMDKVTADDPTYLERNTQIAKGNQQVFKVRIETAKQRFNQTGGVHMVQKMVGCEWDDETGDTDGFNQHAFDGEDFISLDLKTLTWVAAKPQAVATKHKWDDDRVDLEFRKKYLSQECLQWLKKYLDCGRSFLLRKELPSVSLLQRTPSHPVSCFATGFFPDRAMIFWRKDGEELHHEVEMGELLPNHDGTFQMSTDLTLPEETKDLHKYECVFKLSGVEEEMVYRLDRSSIKTNHKNSHNRHNPIIWVVFIAPVVIGVIIY